jgi:hypothetical protein
MPVMRAVAVMRMAGVRGVARLRMARVGVTEVGDVSMAGSMSAVRIVSNVGETADCHRGEACTAQREAEPIYVHT